MHMRPMDTHIKNRMSPPLGLYTIVSMFRDEHEVVVENENVQELVWTDTPDIVGISGTDKKVIVKTIDTYTDQKNRELARLERERQDRERLEKMKTEIEAKRAENDRERDEWNKKAWETASQEINEMEKEDEDKKQQQDGNAG